MNKIMNIITKLIIMISVLGAFVLQYFSAHKMGMARHMFYMNQKLSKIISLSNVETVIFIVTLIIFVASVAIFIWKKPKLNIVDKGLFAVISILIANELLFLNVDYTVAFYFKCILFLLALFSQSIFILFRCMHKE